MFYKLRTDIFKFLNLIAMYLILTYNTALQKHMLWLTIICMTHFLCWLHADISLFCFFFLLEKEDVVQDLFSSKQIPPVPCNAIV